MALDKRKLKSDIIAIQTEMIGKQEKDFEAYAERLATAIDAFVKSGKVVVEAGIAVSTTGSASAQTGKTTAKGTGNIE